LKKSNYYKNTTMKNLLLFLLFIGSSTLHAQEEPKNYEAVSNMIVNNYNQEYFDGIFNLYAQSMKDYLPLEKTQDFFKSIYGSVGKIETSKFIKFENGLAKYKTNFENGLYAINFALDKENKIVGLLVNAFVENKHPTPERNLTSMILPFHGDWHVFWGGDTEEDNYHVVSKAQKNAFDLVIMDEDGKSYKGEGKSNEDYYAFGEDIIAPCDAEVVLAVDGIKDNVPGEMNPIYALGNAVILKTDKDEYLYFAHFKQSSIQVKQGDQVKQGQLLGHCGNSGNSSEAHLHFHIQNIEDINEATGMKCYFKKINVNGEIKEDYSPVKGSVISNM